MTKPHVFRRPWFGRTVSTDDFDIRFNAGTPVDTWEQKVARWHRENVPIMWFANHGAILAADDIGYNWCQWLYIPKAANDDAHYG